MSTLTIPFQYAANLPLVPANANTVAYIVDVETGDLYDEAFNFETAMTYIAARGYIAIACAPDAHRTVEAMQAAFDQERRYQEDCFGLDAVA